MESHGWFNTLLETISSFAVTLPAAVGFGVVGVFIGLPLIIGIWMIAKRFFDENQRP